MRWQSEGERAPRRAAPDAASADRACERCGAPLETLHAGLRDRHFDTEAPASGFAIAACATCDRWVLLPRPSPDALDDLYRDYYTHGHGGAAPSGFERWVARATAARSLGYARSTSVFERATAPLAVLLGFGGFLLALQSIAPLVRLMTRQVHAHSAWHDSATRMFERASLPPDLLPNPLAVTQSLYDVLGKAGVRPVRATQRISSVNLGPAEAELLGVAPSAAGLRIERISYLPDGRVVEFTRSLYRGDAYDFVAELRLSES